MLDVGISSTEHIARSWGLTPSFERRVQPDARATTSKETGSDDRKEVTNYVQDVIENALRSAGLMR
jgi:hypothetical protein